MAKYKVEWLERVRTSSGKNMLKVSLKDDKDVMHDNVAIWEGFPNFTDMKAGDDVDGDLVVKQNGQYENKSLYAPKLPMVGNFKPSGGVSKLMDKKAEMIEKAQERKSDSIAFFNATNSAIALLKDAGITGEAEMKVKIRAWRDWFINEYEDYNTKAPF